MSAHVPPHDLDAEAAVLSSAILDREAVEICQAIVSADSFYADAHRQIWNAVEHLTLARTQVDLVTVARRLQEIGRLEQIGGTPYLAQLVDSTPAVAHVADHARIVQGLATKRAIISALQRRLSEVQHIGDGAIAISDLAKFVSDTSAELEALTVSRNVSTLHHVQDLVRSMDESMSARKSGSSELGISTGIQELDRYIGGLKRGCKYSVGARPGIGKTGFLCSLSISAALSNHGVVLISLEMPKEQLTDRLVAQRGLLNTMDLERGRVSASELGAYKQALSDVARMPIVVDESGSQTAQSIRSAVRRGVKMLREKDPRVKLGLIGIDYVQLVTPSGKKRDRSREQELAEISTATRQLAKEFDCAVVELSQLSRDIEKRPNKRPQLSDMKDSGALEADAYCVLGLYRDDYYRKPDESKDNLAEVIALKVRGGKTGSVGVSFHAPSAGFFEIPDRYDMSGPMQNHRWDDL